MPHPRDLIEDKKAAVAWLSLVEKVSAEFELNNWYLAAIGKKEIEQERGSQKP